MTPDLGICYQGGHRVEITPGTDNVPFIYASHNGAWWLSCASHSGVCHEKCWPLEMYPELNTRTATLFRKGNRMMRIQEIAIPYKHESGFTVVDIDFPEDRPRVVDLVLDDGTRISETRDAVYVFVAGMWTSVRTVTGG